MTRWHTSLRQHLRGLRRPRYQNVLCGLAGVLPLAVYIATASGHAHWLDSAEFVAAASDFGVAHPPGQPLMLVALGLAHLVPVGPLAFRLALIGGVFAAGAAMALYRAAMTTFCTVGMQEASAAGLALAAAWWLALSQAWWLQAVRPEVYALQAFLIMIVLERLLAFERAWPTTDMRSLYVASFALGLALANHHFLALLVLPAGASAAARAFRQRGPQFFMRCAGGVLLGLSTYVYLPLRARSSPMLNLGDPSSLARFWWVVSAEAFQKNQGHGVPKALSARLFDVLLSLAESVHPVSGLLALGGAYVLLRMPRTRRLGTVWLVTVTFFVAARAWLGFVRHNPDALGYLMPALAAVMVFACALVVPFFVLVENPTVSVKRKHRRRLTAVVALLCAALSCVQLPRSSAESNLALFTATDVFDTQWRRTLPTRSVVFVHGFDTAFAFWGAEAEHASRPDITLVPMPFLHYPRFIDALVAAHPELTETLRGYVLDGALQPSELQTLAAERPVFVEMDPRVSPELYTTLVPHGLLHRVLAGGTTRADEREGRTQQARVWAHLEAQLTQAQLTQAQHPDQLTQAQLSYRAYNAALYYAGFGDLDTARLFVEKAQTWHPEDALLARFAQALHKATQTADAKPHGTIRKPLDIRPFLPNTSP